MFHFPLQTTYPPISGKVRVLLLTVLTVGAITLAMATASNRSTILYAPSGLQLAAAASGILAGLAVVGLPFGYHWFIRPLYAHEQQTRSARYVWLMFILMAWLVGSRTNYKVLLQGSPPRHDTIVITHETPILAVYETHGRSSSEGFVMQAIDPGQSLIWHFRSYHGRNWQADRGHCVHFALVKTRAGVRYIGNSHQAPCTRAWPEISAATRQALNAYLKSHGKLDITHYVDASAVGIERSYCSLGYHMDRLVFGTGQR